eukprot:Nitzschia sp. Nitz4//scaffold184_size43902//35072//35995//NITZ4_007288-RA/size43902-processed-gene-0.17-mRNA-1//-1//CDS//3329539669//2841//frame0
MAMESPTGVADFLQVDSKSLDKDLNCSFSWVECPIQVQPLVQNKYSDKESENSSSVASLLAKAQRRLDWLEEQREKDRQDYYLQLNRAKAELRRDLIQKYAPRMKHASSASKKYDNQVNETTKIIQYLRVDNARLRDEIQFFRKAIVKQRTINEELEAANESARRTHEELEKHVKGLEAVQDKLTVNSKVFKEALIKMKSDYAQRTLFYNTEAKTTAKYENCIAKVVNHIRTKQNREMALLENVQTMGEAAVVHVSNDYAQRLQKDGVNITDFTRKQPLLKALHPEMNQGDDDSDSDSCSDTESESD